MRLELEISEETLRDIVSTAAEGGSNYWAAFRRNSANHWQVRDAEDGGTWTDLWLATVRNGVEVAARVAKRHAGDLIAGRWDANTADVILQCALFGEVKYG